MQILSKNFNNSKCQIVGNNSIDTNNDAVTFYETVK